MRKIRGIPYIILAILLLLPFNRVFAGGGYLTGIDSYVPYVEPFASQFPDARPGPWTFAVRKDSLTQTIPSKHFTQSELHAGRLPLWNPYIFCGTPHQADMYSQVFSITDTPFLYFMSVDAALTVASILKLLLLGLGMFLLARRFGIRWEFACIASIAMCLNFQQLHWLIIPAFLSTVLYLPWMFLAWDKYLRGEGTGWLFLCGFLGGLSALGGQMQLFITIWIILLLYTLFGRTYHGRKASIVSVLTIAAAFLGAIGLAFVQILPGLEFAELTLGRDNLSLSAKLTSVMSRISNGGWRQVITNFARLFAPYAYHPSNTSYYSLYKELIIYLGLLSPAIIAALWRWKRTALMNYLWWISLVSLLMIIFNVLAEGLLSVLPFTRFQSLRRMGSLIFFFHMSLLIPLTLQYIVANLDSRLLGRLKKCVACALIPLAIYFLLCSKRYFIDGIHLDHNQGLYFLIFYVISIMIGVVFLIILRGKHLKNTILPVILLGLFFFEMWNYGSHQIVVSRIHSDQLVSEKVDLQDGRLFRTSLTGKEGNTWYPPNTGMLAGIHDAQGYNPLNISAYRRLFETIYPSVESNPRRIIDLPDDYSTALPLLKLIKVNNVLTWNHNEEGFADAQTASLKLFESLEYQILNDRKFWGTAFSEAERIDPDEFYNRLGKGELELENIAYITAGEYSNTSIKPGQVSTETRNTIRKSKPREVIITFDNVGAGEIFMLPENNYPGWRVYVDDRRAELLTVDGTFLGVQLEEGDRTVEFIFNPVAYRIGLIISIIFFMVVALMFAGGLLVRRNYKPIT